VDADLATLPEDVEALKAALLVERASHQQAAAERDAKAAELAAARAKASEDLALIAHQELRIAKLERQRACCMDPEFRRTRPNPIRDQAMRTEIGRPSSSMRLSA
jgi:hypothetical protein